MKNIQLGGASKKHMTKPMVWVFVLSFGLALALAFFWFTSVSVLGLSVGSERSAMFGFFVLAWGAAISMQTMNLQYVCSFAVAASFCLLFYKAFGFICMADCLFFGVVAMVFAQGGSILGQDPLGSKK